MRISDWSSDVCSSDLRHARDGDVRRDIRIDAAQCLVAHLPARLVQRRRQGVAGADEPARSLLAGPGDAVLPPLPSDRKSAVEGRSVSVRVDLGGRSIIKKKKKPRETYGIIGNT